MARVHAPRTRGVELLRVSGPTDARAALDAVHGIRLFDGRSAAWSVLRRGLWSGGLVVAFLGFGFGDRPFVPMIVLGFAVAALGSVFPTWWGRRCGSEPRMSPRAVAAAMAVVAWVVFVLLYVVLDAWWALTLVIVGPMAAAYTFTAPARLAWDRFRAGPPGGWPPGTEAFAVLSTLEQTYWMHPDRLAAAVSMPVDVTETWVQALRSVGALTSSTSLSRAPTPRHRPART